MDRTDEPEQYLCLTKTELANHLRMSTRQVEKLLKKGKLPQPLRFSEHPRWLLDDIRDWLREFPQNED